MISGRKNKEKGQMARMIAMGRKEK